MLLGHAHTMGLYDYEGHQNQRLFTKVVAPLNQVMLPFNAHHAMTQLMSPFSCTTFTAPPTLAFTTNDAVTHVCVNIHLVWRASPFTRGGRALTLARASIWCRTMGLLPNSTRGLGLERVSGLNLVPNPPTNISAFIVEKRSRANRTRRPQVRVKV